MSRVPAIASVAALIVCLRVTGANPDLRRRLRTGDPLTMVVFGDSISVGYQIQDPERDAFYSVFEQALDIAYPGNRLELITAGLPGATAAYGHSQLGETVLAHDPDIVTVQFGGNDERLQTPPDRFNHTISTIIADLRDAGVDEQLLLIQPFQQREANSPMVRLLQQTAREWRLPVVDFDTALRRRPHDMRGWYAPFFNHPRAYSGGIMGRALWHTFSERIGDRIDLKLAVVETAQTVRNGATVPLVCRLTNVGQPRAVTVSLWHEGRRRLDNRRLRMGRGATTDAAFDLALPRGLQDDRTLRRKLLCTARTDAGMDMVVAWVGVAPSRTPRAGAEGWTELGSRAHVVLGDANWTGPEDCSARFRTSVDGDALRIDVAVTDDRRHTVAESAARPLFFGDCVQVNLDLRERTQQGRPLYSPEVPQLFLVPGETRPRFVEWSFGDAPEHTVGPTGPWAGATMTSSDTETGYTVSVSLPLAALTGGGGDPACLGFDVVVDDSDDGRGRDSQLTWCGSGDNYLNPGWYGEIRLDDDASDRLRVTIH